MQTNYIFVRNGTAYEIDAVGELNDWDLIHAAHSAVHVSCCKILLVENKIVFSSELGTLYKA